MAPRTLIIGDEIAQSIDDQLRQIPGTLPLWADVWPGSVAEAWAGEARAPETIAQIAGSVDATGAPIGAPNQVIVALGRSEIAHEPADVTTADLNRYVRQPVNDLLDQLQKSGVSVVWVLPPRQAKERKARDVMRTELVRRGVRMFDASLRSYPVDAQGLLTDTGPRRLAVDLARWLPLGNPGVQIAPSQAGATTPGGLVTNLPQTISDAAASTGGKVFLGVVGLGVVGLGAYYLSKRRSM